MNAVEKRLSVVGITVALILFWCASLSGQTLSFGERFVSYLDSNSHLHVLFAPNGGSWTDVDVSAKNGIPAPVAGSALTSFVDNSDHLHIEYIATTHQIWELT